MALNFPPWRIAIDNALAEYPGSTVIQLATVGSTTPTVPYVRCHIFREFLYAPSMPSLPLILTTTDVRTPKVSQITSNPHVQIVWWIEGTQEQYRISGLAGVVPAPDHGLYKHFLFSTETTMEETGITALRRERFYWEEKRQQVFRSLSGHMRASWCRPVPGSRLEGGEEEAKKWPVTVDEPAEGDEDPVARINWDTALSNFALLVVDPTDVDYVELAVEPNRRTRFWRTKSGGWDSEALVP